MKDLLQEGRKRFLSEVARKVGTFDGRLILLTHILPDRPELIEAIERIAPIARIIAIPYSRESETYQVLSTRYEILTPTLAELRDAKYLTRLALEAAGSKEIIIVEIGGYFAPIIRHLRAKLGRRLRGVVEDTEAGHRAYATLGNLPCPVVSVARSALKEAEDVLIGISCLFSVERLLRGVGFLLESRRSLVLGYGRIGRGVARALHARLCPVMVYDLDPIRRVLALAEGYLIPERSSALSSADVIFGATGSNSVGRQDFEALRSGTVLVSCSSKDLEFDLSGLANYARTEVTPAFDRYAKDQHVLYVLANGRPVNFLDGAVVGPILTLVQAEILLGIKMVLDLPKAREILNVTTEARRELAQLWIKTFCQPGLGSYFQA